MTRQFSLGQGNHLRHRVTAEQLKKLRPIEYLIKKSRMGSRCQNRETCLIAKDPGCSAVIDHPLRSSVEIRQIAALGDVGDGSQLVRCKILAKLAETGRIRQQTPCIAAARP